MNPTRRTFLASAAAGVAAVGLGGTAIPGGRGTVKLAARVTTPGGWDSRRLSQAVLDATVRDFSIAYTRARQGVLGAGDLRAAGASGRTLFAHLNEIGLTDTEEREMVARRDDLLVRPPDETQVVWMHGRFVDAGVPMSRDQVRAMLAPPRERIAAALDGVEQRGLRAVRATLGPRLDAIAARLERREGARLRPVASTEDELADPCKEFQWVIDVIAVTAALNALGCAAGVAPCCAIAVGEGIAAAVLQLVHDIFC